MSVDFRKSRAEKLLGRPLWDALCKEQPDIVGTRWEHQCSGSHILRDQD